MEGQWSKEKADEAKQKLIDGLKKEYGMPDDTLNWVGSLFDEMIKEEEERQNNKGKKEDND